MVAAQIEKSRERKPRVRKKRKEPATAPIRRKTESNRSNLEEKEDALFLEFFFLSSLLFFFNVPN